MAATLEELTRHLDGYLHIAELPDDRRALNGLQLENSGRVTRILGAVDACQATIDAAAERHADLLLVHHGLFWGGLQAAVGRHGRRLRALISHDIALYSAHLPLDRHPEVGNNAVLARALGVEALEPFGRADGEREIGWAGPLELPLAELVGRIERRLGVPPLRVVATGPDPLRRVAVVTGAGSGLLAEARDRGIDTLVTGEGPHHAYFDAEEWGLNLILAGHYASETVGVQALGAHLAERFGLPFEFFDHPTGL